MTTDQIFCLRYLPRVRNCCCWGVFAMTCGLVPPLDGRVVLGVVEIKDAVAGLCVTLRRWSVAHACLIVYGLDWTRSGRCC